ncbi:hypothetical protein VNO77_27503 [Canavalia gladiata]|uniref:Uncharacterized protein n=1 Tax=Canavalia gladiata TaxID=3824 RepID=A0AAN9KXE4_CANGL
MRSLGELHRLWVHAKGGLIYTNHSTREVLHGIYLSTWPRGSHLYGISIDGHLYSSLSLFSLLNSHCFNLLGLSLVSGSGIHAEYLRSLVNITAPGAIYGQKIGFDPPTRPELAPALVQRHGDEARMVVAEKMILLSCILKHELALQYILPDIKRIAIDTPSRPRDCNTNTVRGQLRTDRLSCKKPEFYRAFPPKLGRENGCWLLVSIASDLEVFPLVLLRLKPNESLISNLVKRHGCSGSTSVSNCRFDR